MFATNMCCSPKRCRQHNSRIDIRCTRRRMALQISVVSVRTLGLQTPKTNVPVKVWLRDNFWEQHVLLQYSLMYCHSKMATNSYPGFREWLFRYFCYDSTQDIYTVEARHVSEEELIFRTFQACDWLSDASSTPSRAKNWIQALWAYKNI